uniref:Uncharacterized protein n=1 Tax=Pavo cristatus TaxID=9049 RepID=A0A8C9FVR0_PAVCR
MQSYQRLPGNALLRGFRVSYKRHVLTMDDLQTLYGPNWLNDQVGGEAGRGQMFGGSPQNGEDPQNGGGPQNGMGVLKFPPIPQVMNMYGDLVMDAV